MFDGFEILIRHREGPDVLDARLNYPYNSSPIHTPCLLIRLRLCGSALCRVSVVDEKHVFDNGEGHYQHTTMDGDTVAITQRDPTLDELGPGPHALRKVSAPIPWSVYTVAFVELCERFFYYGTQVVCMLCNII